MRGFGKSTCPVRAHHDSHLLNNLTRCNLHWIIPFASESAPRVHQKKPSAPARYPQFARQELRYASVNNQETNLERVIKPAQESRATLKPGVSRTKQRTRATVNSVQCRRQGIIS